ncbi:MAG: hypothetical protein ING12_08170 [Roseomonas sp.]|nr:hypothetical protein [Roseomonas sp.]
MDGHESHYGMDGCGSRPSNHPPARERLEALNAGCRELYEKLQPLVSFSWLNHAGKPYHSRRYLCDVPY